LIPYATINMLMTKRITGDTIEVPCDANGLTVIRLHTVFGRFIPTQQPHKAGCWRQGRNIAFSSILAVQQSTTYQKGLEWEVHGISPRCQQ
jgi:hypothetical protein